MSFLRELPTRHSKLVVIVAVLLTLVSIACCFRLTPETSIEGLLDPSDPSVHAMGQVLKRFPVVEEMLVLATLPDGAGADESKLTAFAERLAQRAAIDEAGKTTMRAVTYRPSTDMVKFVAQVMVPNGIYYLDDANYAGAMHRLTRAGMDAQLADTRAALALPGPAAGGLSKAMAKDPLRLNEFLMSQLARMPGGGSGFSDPDPTKAAFFSPDRRSLLIRIAGTKPPSDLSFCREMVDAVNGLVSSSNTDGLRVEMAGAYAVAAHNADAIRTDAIIGVNGSIVGIALLFLFLYRRSMRMFLFAFTPMAMGIAWGFGCFALLKPSFTPLAAVVGGALGGIGIDYLVFYLAHHDEDRSRHPDRRIAIAATSQRLRGSLRTAWLTSVVGFASVAWSPIGVLRDFALLGTLALGGAYLATIILLPASLATFDRDPRPLATTRLGFVRPMGRFIARRPIGVLGGTCVALVGAVVYLALAGSSFAPASDLMLLHPRPNPPIEVQRHIAQRMGIAPGSMQIYLEADTPERLLQLAHDVDARLRDPRMAAAGSTGAVSVASVLPDPRRAAERRASLDGALSARVQTDFAAAIRDAGFNTASFTPYATFLQRLVAPGVPPTIAALHDYPAIGQLVLSRDAIADPTKATDALCMVFFDNPLERRDERDAAIAALRASLEGVVDASDPTRRVTITGMAVVGAHVESAIRRDLPKLVLAAVVWIALCHAVHFRSIGLALLSMVPTAISAVAVLVFMSATDQPLNLVNMVMVPLLLGIDTDYGILTVNAWKSAGGTRRGLLRAFPTTASAVITCAGTTIIGFGSLVLTTIPAVQSLGWLINVGIVACLLGTVIGVWPVMFLLARGDKRARA